jgi:hypothetical protein
MSARMQAHFDTVSSFFLSGNYNIWDSFTTSCSDPLINLKRSKIGITIAVLVALVEKEHPMT